MLRLLLRPWPRPLLGAVVVSALVGGAAAAQTPTPPPPAGPFRKLAPGVEQSVETHRGQEPLTAVSRHDLIEVLAADPNFRARIPAGNHTEVLASPKNIRFDHQIRELQFFFKPVRFVKVDVPDFQGKMRQKLVWYMVYRVQNLGNEPFRFVPKFWMEDLDRQQSFADKLIPVAVPAIRRREDPNRPLLNTVEIAGEIPPSAEGEDKSVWGVVTWDDIPSTTIRFSVFVQGLSTAYQWEDPAGAYQKGDPPGTGRKLTQKTLQLNFWRPSDVYFEHEQEIRYGSAGRPGDVDYVWLYR